MPPAKGAMSSTFTQSRDFEFSDLKISMTRRCGTDGAYTHGFWLQILEGTPNCSASPCFGRTNYITLLIELCLIKG